eukprot:TRINITY_DN47664_c0_g1_i1.p1 TRINITY_DN47664_c0_g1~~TRINITY_DN47664_c0_g1_i1.p1  ORF type:complete len:379 (-),score=33.73 TRINITY_DN47664_c0_g1_i1:154-1245(-)
MSSFECLAFFLLSAFFNASYPAWQRFSKACDPVIFSGFACLGVFLSSVFTPMLLNTEYVFTGLGFASGALFAFMASFAFIAIRHIGLLAAKCTWSCSAIIVAFAWGAFGPVEVVAAVRNLSMSYVAILLLLGGSMIIVGSAHLVRNPDIAHGGSESDGDTQLACSAVDEGDVLSTSGTENSLSAEPISWTRNLVCGFAFALIAGLFSGSLLVPFKFIHAHGVGLAAMPSLGLGALTVGTIGFLGRWYLMRQDKGYAFTATALVVGIFSGVTWNAGNVCAILVQGPPFYLPYGIAYPILQCAPLFGSIWVVCLFREIRGTALFFFALGVLELMAGIFILRAYGPGATVTLGEDGRQNASLVIQF